MSAPAPTPRFPFPSYPKGWFAVAFSDELPVNEVRPLRYFGRDLVAFRTASGRAHVTSAYCPHLGAHLAHGGAVEGETLRCPFHGWRFAGDGRCAAIPYTRYVPPRAELEAFETLEQDGVIHVFFDPEGGPSWPLPELDAEGWTRGRTITWRGLRTHPQEVFENTVDTAHIGPVHDGRRARLLRPPRREGETMIVDLEFDAPGDVVGMPDQLNEVELSVTLIGLGWVRVETHVRNVGVRARQRILATPVDEDTIDIRGIVHVRETDDPAFTEELDRIFYEAYVTDFAKDFPIWENKRYLERPRVAKGDGPIGTYRKWCEQFYVEPRAVVADVSVEALRGSSRATGWRSLVGAVKVGLATIADRGGRLVGARERASRGTSASRDASAGTDASTSAGASTSTSTSAGASTSTDASTSTSTSTSTSAGTSTSTGASTGASTSAGTSAGTRASAGTSAGVRTGAAPRGGKPARVESAREYRETLPDRFVPEAAAGVDAVFQWELGGDGGETFHAHVRHGRLDVRDGAHPEPTVTLTMSAADYVRVVNGELDGMSAFTTGRGKVGGSLRMAMKMRTLFPA